MPKTYTERLNVNDDTLVEKFNLMYNLFVKKYGYDVLNPPEFITRDQAAEFLGCSKQDVATMVYRGVIQKGHFRGDVNLDDVVSKKVIAPFQSRS